MPFTLNDGPDFPGAPSLLASCNECQYLDWTSWSQVPMRCAAFPAGIPIAILQGQHAHKTHYPGDHGLLFTRATHLEKLPAEPEAA